MESKIISATEIPSNAAYVGYLWLSDSAMPKVLDRANLDVSLFDTARNPFVVEGFLYDEQSSTSFSIRYVDGETIVCKHTLTEIDREDNAVREYYGNRMEGRKLKFLDVWEPVKDELCLQMEVLQPQAEVFIGFVEPDNNKK